MNFSFSKTYGWIAYQEFIGSFWWTLLFLCVFPVWRNRVHLGLVRKISSPAEVKLCQWHSIPNARSVVDLHGLRFEWVNWVNFSNIFIFFILIYMRAVNSSSLWIILSFFFCLFFIYFLFPWHIRLSPCTPAPAAIHVFSLVVWIFFLLLVVVEAVGRRMAEISIISGMIAFYRRNVFDKTFKKSRLFSYYIEIKTANILERTSVNIKHFTLLWDSF